MTPDVFYICDRKECTGGNYECSNSECKHTSYEGHALHENDLEGKIFVAHDGPDGVVGLFEVEPNGYWERICAIQRKQIEKGLKKYGQVLEEYKSLSVEDRLLYLEEELVDALMYLEHLKEALKEEK